MFELFSDPLVASASGSDSFLLWASLLIPIIAVMAYPALAKKLLSLQQPTPLQQEELQRTLPFVDASLVGNFRIWNTGNRICNAAVVGCVPRFSMVLISDALLQRLSPRESAAIVAHELGHLRLWHVPIRLSIVFAGGLLGMAMVQYAEQVGTSQLLSQSIVILGTMLYMSLMLHFVAPLLEFQADLFAVDLLSRESGDRNRSTCTLLRALARLTDLSGIRTNQKTWLYPSFEQRRQAILFHKASPRLQWTLRIVLGAIFLSQTTLVIGSLIYLIK